MTADPTEPSRCGMRPRVVAAWFRGSEHGWWPRLYEGFFARTRWGRSIRESEARAIVGLLRAHGVSGRRVLEVGAGTGAYTDLLARAGADVVVLEPSPAMRSYLRARARRGQWPAVDIRAGSLPDDVEVSSTFEVVLTVGVLNYLPDLGSALAPMAEALDADGVLIMNVPAGDRSGATRYRALEALVRRRVYCRTGSDVEIAARHAGLRLESGPITAGVTDVYVLRPRAKPARPGPRGSSKPPA